MTTTVREAPQQLVPPSARVRFRVARAAGLGGVLAAAVVIAGIAGVLHGPWVLALMVIAVLAVPTSRQLSRRILLSVCLGFGWLPVLWWVHLPVGDLGRGGLVLAFVVAGLGFWVGWGHDPRARARLLLPRLHVVDVLPFLAAGVSAAVLSPWLQSKSAPQSVGLLMRGWDHAGHFSMVHMIRAGGVTVDLAAPPSAGDTWWYANYPQAFHAIAATIIDVLVGPQNRGLPAEVNAYCQAVAIITLCSVAMIVAGLCALPALRNRSLLALPIATFATAVFVLGPGADLIDEGFPNFSYACTLVCAVALVAAPMARIVSPIHLAALGGAIVGVANGWILLLALAGPAALILLFPHQRQRWTATRRQYTASAVIVLATIACVARAGVVVSRVPLSVGNTLTLWGAIVAPNLVVAALGLVGTYVMCVLLGRRRAADAPRALTGPAERVQLLRGVPVAGILVTAGLLAMLAVRGGGSYYFMKFLIGTDVVCLVLVLIPLALLAQRFLSERPVRAPRSAGRQLAFSVVVAVAATQVFGLALPGAAALGLRSTAVGLSNPALQIHAVDNPPLAADVVNVAPALAGALDGHTVVYFRSPSDGYGNPQLAALWYLALTGDVTSQDYQLAGAVGVSHQTTAEVAASVSRILIARPDAYVAVQADQVRQIRALLTGSAQPDHVVGW